MLNIIILLSYFVLAQLRARGLLYWPEEDLQMGQYEIT